MTETHRQRKAPSYPSDAKETRAFEWPSSPAGNQHHRKFLIRTIGHDPGSTGRVHPVHVKPTRHLIAWQQRQLERRQQLEGVVIAAILEEWREEGTSSVNMPISPPYLLTEAKLETAYHRVLNRPEHYPGVS